MEGQEVDQGEGHHGDPLGNRMERSLRTFSPSNEVVKLIAPNLREYQRKLTLWRIVEILKTTREKNLLPEDYANPDLLQRCNTNNHNTSFREFLESFNAADCQRVFFEVFTFLRWRAVNVKIAMGHLTHFACGRSYGLHYETPPALRRHLTTCMQNPYLQEWQDKWFDGYTSENSDSDDEDAPAVDDEAVLREGNPANEDMPDDPAEEVPLPEDQENVDPLPEVPEGEDDGGPLHSGDVDVPAVDNEAALEEGDPGDEALLEFPVEVVPLMEVAANEDPLPEVTAGGDGGPLESEDGDAHVVDAEGDDGLLEVTAGYQCCPFV